jgi:hypothetical protein
MLAGLCINIGRRAGEGINIFKAWWGSWWAKGRDAPGAGACSSRLQRARLLWQVFAAPSVSHAIVVKPTLTTIAKLGVERRPTLQKPAECVTLNAPARRALRCAAGRPRLPLPPLPPLPPHITMVKSQPGQSCQEACWGVRKGCTAEHMASFNDCNALRELFPCEAGKLALQAPTLQAPSLPPATPQECGLTRSVPFACVLLAGVRGNCALKAAAGPYKGLRRSPAGILWALPLPPA